MGKLVRVTVEDGRVFVGKLQAIDWKLNIFLQSSSIIINKKNPLYY